MAITWGFLNPPPGGGGAAQGDVFVSRASGNQWRWNGVAWETIELRADVLPHGGLSDEHLARDGGDTFRTRWVIAAEGMVWDQEFPVPSDEWQCLHGLRYRWVSVQVVNTDGTIVLGDVEFVSTLGCIIRFAKPVAGVVTIRR